MSRSRKTIVKDPADQPEMLQNIALQVSDEELATRVRSLGLKATVQRLAVLRVLSSTTRPLSIPEMEKRITSNEANQSTLYRAVHDLITAGIVRSVDLRHSHMHYELRSEKEHHHLICAKCGLVEEFSLEVCKKLERAVLQKSTRFASVADHSFELYGVCSACAQITA